MDLQIDIELQGGILLVTASGSFTFDAALRLLKQFCDTASEIRVSHILVNCLAMYGELSAFDRYSLGAEFATYLRQRQMNPRLAFVGEPPTIDAFAVRVGQNRGLTAEVFSSQQEALNWLDKWPNRNDRAKSLVNAVTAVGFPRASEANILLGSFDNRQGRIPAIQIDAASS